MRPFKFTAQAALQLRRRQHDEALAGQATAERAVMEAERAAREAGEAVRHVDARLTAETHGSFEVSRLRWHIAWRARCVGERERLDGVREQRQRELEAARLVVSESRRRVRSLERLRENALHEWEHGAQMEERKTMDALAGSQFVRRRDER